jgi:glycosyltransferase involved in cell wall biosynthesis
MVRGQRILLVSGEYPPMPGGIGDYTLCLAQALSARGHQVAVLTALARGYTLYAPAVTTTGASATAASVLLAETDLPLWSWDCWRAVIAALDCWRPDWIHIQYQTGAFGMHPAINLLPWRLQGLGLRPRLAVTFHDLLEPYLFPKAGIVRRWITLRLAHDVDALIVTNAADALQLQAIRNEHGPTAVGPLHRLGLPMPEEPVLIPIGSNIPVAPVTATQRDQWRERHGIAPDAFVVVYFGLISPSKGVDLLIDALLQLSNRIPWYLVLVGSVSTADYDAAYAERMTTRLAQPDLASRSLLTGHLEPVAVSLALSAADCVVLPYQDGASFRRGSLLAALAHGCPVITSRPADSDTRARLIDGRHALLVPPGSRSAIAEALTALAVDPTRAHELASGGRALASQFSWEQIAALHEKLYTARRHTVLS